jgi:hypothetical protein
MSSLPLTTNMSGSTTSLKELCVVCQNQPYDLICTCGDKFDFTCIHAHVEQIGLEFQFVQNQLGERLLSIEQTIEDNNCANAKTIIENWVCTTIIKSNLSSMIFQSTFNSTNFF